jgi:hypothetical protein
MGRAERAEGGMKMNEFKDLASSAVFAQKCKLKKTA